MEIGSYVPGGIDAISRVRAAAADLPDANGAVAVGDPQLARWVDDSLSDERLLLYLPESYGGATGATVEVELDPEAAPNNRQALILKLTRTGLGAADTLTFVPSRAYGRLEQVIRWIHRLDKGWRVGFQAGDDREWLSSSHDFALSLVTVGSFMAVPSLNLAPTDGAVTAYGQQSSATLVGPAELRFYRIGAVARKVVDLSESGQDITNKTIRSLGQGDMSISFETGRQAAIARLIREGIFAT